MKHLLCIPFLGLTLILLAGCEFNIVGVSASHDFQASHSIEGPVMVKVRSFNGSIEVGSTEHSRVEIMARAEASAMTQEKAQELANSLEPTIQFETGTLTIDARPRTQESDRLNASISLKLLIPANCELDLSTSNGAIYMDHRRATIHATTTNGAIRADDVQGVCKLSTQNGSVNVENGSGTFDIKTSNGKIVTKSVQWKGENRLQTSNGAIQILLISDSPVQLDCSTSNGKITCQTPLGESEKKENHLSGVAFSEKATEETPKLNLKTSNGAIDIQMKDAPKDSSSTGGSQL